jgi:hypothetical protein
MTVDEFIERWRRNEGGAERANYVLFLTELCALLELPQPDPADATHERNDYTFERAVQFKDEAGRAGHGRIDLYRRGAFVLEAKQSRERGGKKEVALPIEQVTLPGLAPGQVRGRRSAQRGWDVLMRNAREQAEQYARALPTDHGWPPFILVCDVGHAIEVFADFSGQGKTYRQFPDRQGFRIYLDDLRDPTIQARLRAIWLEPSSLDPAKHAAEVTRDIAKRLASVSKLLEDRGYKPEPVAHFLMRCLFTMFAEDSGLLEKGSFLDVLGDARSSPDSFAPMLEELWKTMDTGGFSTTLRRAVRRFNGGLFAERTAIPLHKEEIGELYEAAKHVWTEVEPAIFGTLLEQALDKDERKRLGAHYTPRAYVERLVNATIIEPLKAEWEGAVLGTVERERESDPKAAIKAVHDFHVKLATTRVLDPACGTGNFLYVALELLKRLEGDVLQVLEDVGGQDALAMENTSVHPRNFLGMELNPRAAAIAELVLWLGYLQWQMRNGSSIVDPVLEKLSNITAMDAVLKHDPERPASDGGTELPNPRRPKWPEADYIVGNPPFIGKGSPMRTALGEAYVEALWAAHPQVGNSADFVMYWVDKAAELLVTKGTRLQAFGFVTTNSITQEFSRRVLERRMKSRNPISLTMAIADHPWKKGGKEVAAVRIAMVVARAGVVDGTLWKVVEEEALDSDQPKIGFRALVGKINSNMTIGTDVNISKALKANSGLGSNGMLLAGKEFVISPAVAGKLPGKGAPSHLVRDYIGGGEIVNRNRSAKRKIIDTYDFEKDQLLKLAPDVYQYLLTTVKIQREETLKDHFSNDAKQYAERWWRYAKDRVDLREALSGIHRFVATVETIKHRTFQFVDAKVIPNHMIIAVAVEGSYVLSVLSSRIHLEWTYANCGLMGVAKFEQGHRYTKSKIFDRFPFPDMTKVQMDELEKLGESLDSIRKEALSEHSDLTLTGLYNLRAKLKKGEPFDLVEQDQRARGRVDIIAELHDRIDRAVADAYGWAHDLSDEEIVTRLVGLNAERHKEEKTGKVRWLRPNYQIPKAGVVTLVKSESRQIEALLPEAGTKKPLFPRDAIGQTAAVLAELRGGAELTSTEMARRYSQGLKAEPRISATLAALVRLGHLSLEGDRYSLRRVA